MKLAKWPTSEPTRNESTRRFYLEGPVLELSMPAMKGTVARQKKDRKERGIVFYATYGGWGLLVSLVVNFLTHEHQVDKDQDGNYPWTDDCGDSDIVFLPKGTKLNVWEPKPNMDYVVQEDCFAMVSDRRRDYCIVQTPRYVVMPTKVGE